ncbi:hypothetical protein DFH09DRAFT_1094148 [Mycena vulgaris]|nr:hypothetical protein DFH09DRAFT_1094148 [Mycena vulgaris]
MKLPVNLAAKRKYKPVASSLDLNTRLNRCLYPSQKALKANRSVLLLQAEITGRGTTPAARAYSVMDAESTSEDGQRDADGARLVLALKRNAAVVGIGIAQLELILRTGPEKTDRVGVLIQHRYRGLEVLAEHRDLGIGIVLESLGAGLRSGTQNEYRRRGLASHVGDGRIDCLRRPREEDARGAGKWMPATGRERLRRPKKECLRRGQGRLARLPYPPLVDRGEVIGARAAGEAVEGVRGIVESLGRRRAGSRAINWRWNERGIKINIPETPRVVQAAGHITWSRWSAVVYLNAAYKNTYRVNRENAHAVPSGVTAGPTGRVPEDGVLQPDGGGQGKKSKDGRTARTRN